MVMRALYISFLVAVFLLVLFHIAGNSFPTGYAVKENDGSGNVYFRLTSVIIVALASFAYVSYISMRKRWKSQKISLLLMFWFAGIMGFFLVLSTIFITMIPLKKHQQIILYEPNGFIFWSEIVLLVFVLFTGIWILYNYATGKASLMLVKRPSR